MRSPFLGLPLWWWMNEWVMLTSAITLMSPPPSYCKDKMKGMHRQSMGLLMMEDQIKGVLVDPSATGAIWIACDTPFPMSGCFNVLLLLLLRPASLIFPVSPCSNFAYIFISAWFCWNWDFWGLPPAFSPWGLLDLPIISLACYSIAYI